MPEYGLQSIQLQRWRHPEHAFCVEAAVRDQDVAMRVEAKKIAEGLYGDDCAGNGLLLGSDPLKEVFQRFPGAAAQIMQKFSIPRSGRGQAPRKYRRRIFGRLKTKCRWGTLLNTFAHNHF
jgi:hypothetical protein